MEKSLKEKIRKLIALQEGAQKIGSIEEAANAAEKIRALLMKHNLDLYSIQKEGHEEETEMQTFDTGELSVKTEGDWINMLTRVIAEFHLCEAIGTGKARSWIYVIGKPSNVEIVWYTVEQLANRIRPMAREAFKTYKGLEKRNTFIRGYLMGAVWGIRKQLAEKAAKEAWAAKQDRDNNLIGTQALMMVNMTVKHRIDNEAYKKKVMTTTTARVKSTKSISGKVIGTQAGYGMSINAGIKGGSSSGPNGFLN